MQKSLREITESVEQYLRYLKEEEGVNALSIDPGIVARLGEAPIANNREKSLGNNIPVTAASGAEARDKPTAKPPETKEDRLAALRSLAKQIATCKECQLNLTRTQTVPGQGCIDPDILFIGEGPGGEEDRQGMPFVGRSGALLTRLITRMGYTREQVFIGNIVKCRATVNLDMLKDRAPTTDEMNACIPFLKRQIALLQPKVIVTLGNVALNGLFAVTGITRLHGQWREYEGIATMPTYHPSYLLRQGGEDKKAFWEVWEDMIKVLEFLGRKPPPRNN